MGRRSTKMKIVFIIATFTAAVAAIEPISTNYHEDFGIPLAQRIKLSENALDFDGSRIVGGQNSNLGQHPHMGGLVINLVDGRQSVCGSSLLSNTKLVTAAHCWRDARNQARQFTVVLGSIRLFSGGVRITTNRVELHSGYNTANLNNDLGIITINSVSFNNNINRVALASGSNNYIGSVAVATGFGRYGDASSITQNQQLRHVNLNVINNSFCTNIYGPDVVRSSTLCTAGGRVNICNGDSGGPLTIGSGNNRLLIGVVSFGSRSGCQRGHPGGFSRVTSYYSWIRQRI